MCWGGDVSKEKLTRGVTGVCLAASQKTCIWEFGVTPSLQNCSSVWSSEHMYSISERREPAGWQKNTIGIARVLVLTMSQAALPDGEFEWSQLWVIKKTLFIFVHHSEIVGA